MRRLPPCRGLPGQAGGNSEEGSKNMGRYTSLKDALEEIASGSGAVLLQSGGADLEARDLLKSLPERKLERRVHFMPGFYIAAVGETGCLGEVLYRFKRKKS
jgi:hypothetical protein